MLLIFQGNGSKMIYITASTSPQQIYVPRNGYAVSGTPSLSVQSTSGLETVAVPVTTATVVGDYIRVVFSVPAGLFVGEWRYTLTDNSTPARELARGLLVVVPEGNATKEYNATIEYKQYGD